METDNEESSVVEVEETEVENNDSDNSSNLPEYTDEVGESSNIAIKDTSSIFIEPTLENLHKNCFVLVDFEYDNIRNKQRYFYRKMYETIYGNER